MRRISVILATTILIFLLTACNSELETTGCRVIHQEDNYVTYQQVCENCGYEYGNPTTAHISKKLFYTLTCTRCGKLINVLIQRG